MTPEKAPVTPRTRRPYTAAIGMDALVKRADGSTINFGDAIYHPENAEEARAYAASPATGEGLDKETLLSILRYWFPDRNGKFYEAARSEAVAAILHAQARLTATTLDPGEARLYSPDPATASEAWADLSGTEPRPATTLDLHPEED